MARPRQTAAEAGASWRTRNARGGVRCSPEMPISKASLLSIAHHVGELPADMIFVVVEEKHLGAHDVVTITGPDGVARITRREDTNVVFVLDPRAPKITIGRRSQNDVVISDQRI